MGRRRTPSDTTRPNPARTISGRTVVFGMFGFGALATLLLWYYWTRHLEPFMPLQLALAEQFENSSPRVDGGRRKTHKGTPRILRVVMRVDFDPTADDPATEQVVDERIRRIADIAREHVSLQDYDLLVVHFYQPNPEGSLRQQRFERSVDEFSRETGTA